MEKMPKGTSKCEHCGQLVPSVLKTEHLTNKCPARKNRRRIIQFIKNCLQ
jgi:hypothetical protein